MHRSPIQVILFIMVMVTAAALAGCATAPAVSSAPSQADLLAQAGFKMHSPNSPQKLAYVQTLPAKKVVLNQYNQKPLYLVCTNPDAKQCYLGDQAAYERYQQLAVQNSVTEDQHQIQERRWDPEAWQMWVDSQGGG
jgi:hypothetical protein